MQASGHAGHIECKLDTPAKQWGEVNKSRFVIPFNVEKPAACYTSHAKAYVAALKTSLGVMDPKSDLFKTCVKGAGFSSQVVRTNYLHKVPRQVSSQLKLQHVHWTPILLFLCNTTSECIVKISFYNWRSDSKLNKHFQMFKERELLEVDDWCNSFKS